MNLRCGVARRVGGACSAHVALWPGNGTPFDACRAHLPAEVGEAIRQRRRIATEYDGTPPPAELADHLRALVPVACSCQPGCLVGGAAVRAATREPPAAEEGAPRPDIRPTPPEAAVDAPTTLLCGQRVLGLAGRSDSCGNHCTRWPGPDRQPLNACLEHLDERVRQRLLAERDKAFRDRQPLPDDLAWVARPAPVACECERCRRPTTRPKPKPKRNERNWNSPR